MCLDVITSPQTLFNLGRHFSTLMIGLTFSKVQAVGVLVSLLVKSGATCEVRVIGVNKVFEGTLLRTDARTGYGQTSHLTRRKLSNQQSVIE